ncbi:MAG: carboxypeptidase-like regulatory domain-containing protein [Saprospiraceae bacterium]
MKKNDQNKRLKQLSDQHEVPFNPAAWEKMDALLDNTPPPEPPRPGASFFNYKNILAIIILLMILMYFVVPTGDIPNDIPATETTAAAASQDIHISENNDTTKQQTKTITENDLDKNTLEIGQRDTNGKIIPPDHKGPYIISQPAPMVLNPLVDPIDSSSNIFTKTIPADLTFVQNIEEQLSTYHQFRAEEKVYLHFDRTMLKPGETLWFSAYVRDANNLQPSGKSDMVYVEFIAPNGGVLKQLKLVTKDGIAKGDIQTTAEMVGGIYKIKAYTNWQKNFKTYFERNITLQKTVLPHLRMELDFEREAYGAGDEVVAKLDLKTLENTALVNFAFDYQVSLAGEIFSNQKSQTDDKGTAEFKFNLPKDLATNDGLVNVLLQYNGQGESISRSIPIILNKMDLQFFPEGGDLTAGFEQRVAFKVLNEFGKPADVEGHILNGTGVIVSRFKSYHQGMGAFDLNVFKGGKYTAKITKPQNIVGEFPLPDVLEKGNVMQVVDVDKDKVKVKVQNVDNESLTLVLQSQGKIYNSISTSANAGVHLLEISTEDTPIGLAQLTLFDNQERPHAERLFFLNKEKTLDVKITTDKDQYLPREKVSMKIAVKDEDGKPVKGNFSVGVTDDKLLSFADDKQGKMLAYLLLESDLKGAIEEPNFYFESKEKHADKDQSLALDYLMMTHGWRRFTWKNKEHNAIAQLPFLNEKAIVAGVVMDDFGQVVKDAIVRIEGMEESVVTDEKGRFSFENVSLGGNRKTENAHLSIIASKGGASKILVNNYGEQYMMRLRNANNKNFATKIIPSQGKRLVKGRVTDANGEALIGANILLGRGSGSIGTTADIDGNYTLEIPEGDHVLQVSYTGYQMAEEVISFKSDESLLANVVLNEGQQLDEIVVTSAKRSSRKERKAAVQNITPTYIPKSKKVVITDYRVPLIQQDVTSTGSTVTSEQIRNLPTRNINAIAAATAGASSSDEAISIKGSRSNATDYYIDGVRVNGNLLPESEIAEMQVLTGGTSAKFEGNADLVSDGNFTSLGYGKLEETMEKRTAEGGSITQRNGKKDRITMVGDKVILTDEPMVILDGNVLDKIALADIKPDEIKSVEVHEDDALAANYGERGRNGVIVIDTKKRKGATSNQALLDYQSQLSEKINEQITDYQNQYELAQRMIMNNTLDAGQTRNLRISLNAQLAKISNKRNVATELGRLTGIYPSTNFVDKDLDFIEDLEYARDFKNGFYVAREFYVPKYKTKIKGEARNDFRPTIYWNSNVETDANGNANVAFYNSDDLTTFKVTIEGITQNGKIGNNTHTYFTQMPFGMRTKFPAQVLMGDKLTIPVTLSNNTDAKMEVKLDAIVPPGFKYVGQDSLLYSIGNQETKTVYLPFEVQGEIGEHDLEIKVSANGEEDSFSKKVKVLSRGFPVNMMFSGNDVESDFNIDVLNVIGKNAVAKFIVHPSLLSDLSAGMDRMIRQPTGCFEQTSSKNYPNLLVLDYLKNTNSLDQNLGARLYDVLEKGYQRLLTFEVKGGGFDWYGKPPAHEGLTAYGLMQFKDMQRVHRVDQALIDRTAEWLLTRKNGKGGWKNSKGGLHFWSAENPAGDAYITWAMSEAGFGGKVRPEIEKSYEDARQSKDPYIMALVINTLHNIKDGRADKLLKDLLKLQAEDGSWIGKTSMTRSGGKSLKIETTALAALAIIKVGKGLTQLEEAMNFIAKSKTDYGFGSTQSTVLAMKALIEHAQFSTKLNTDGIVKLMIDGNEVAQQAFTSEQKTPIVFDEISTYFTEGNHNVKVLFAETEMALPFDLSVKYFTSLPKNDADCKVNLKTTLQTPTGKIGENIRLTIHLQNTTNEVLPNTIAKIGIPSGLNLQPWQLKELQEKLAFDYYEIMNSYLVLHYRGMAANETREVNLDLKANLAGTYEAPASVAYLYYTNELRNWSKPESVEINQ